MTIVPPREIITQPSNAADDIAGQGPESRQRLAALAADRNQRLQDLIRSTKQYPRVFLPPVVAVVLSIAVVFPHPVRSLEGRWYDFPYWFSLTLALFMLLWALVKFVVIWVELRPLLLALDRLPLRRGFARMNGFTWRPLWGLGGGAFQDFFVIVARELDLLEKLKQSAPTSLALIQRIEATQRKLNTVTEWA